MNVLTDVLVPALSILIPTGVAVWLARNERKDSRASLRRERVLSAAAPLFEDLARLIHLDPREQDYRSALSTMRAHIAGLRAALDPDDSLVSDWLALRHREGMKLFEALMLQLPGTKFERYVPAAHPPVQSWANVTMQQLQGWISGNVSVEWIREDGARIVEQYGSEDPADGGSRE